jgi:hypothetical protein
MAAPMRVWAAIEPCRPGIDTDAGAEDQLCVPAVAIEGDSWRRREAEQTVSRRRPPKKS